MISMTSSVWLQWYRTLANNNPVGETGAVRGPGLLSSACVTQATQDDSVEDVRYSFVVYICQCGVGSLFNVMKDVHRCAKNFN